MSDGGNDDAGPGSPPDGGRGDRVLAVFDDPAPRTAREVAAATDGDPEAVARRLDALVAAGRLGRKTVGEDDPTTVWYPTPGGNGAPEEPLDGVAETEAGDADAGREWGGNRPGTGAGDPGRDEAEEPKRDEAEEPKRDEAEEPTLEGPDPTGRTDPGGFAGGGDRTAGGGDDGWDLDDAAFAGRDPTPTRAGDAGEFDAVEARLAELDVPGASEMMREWRRGAVRAAFEHLLAEGPVRRAELVETVYPGRRAGYTDPEDWWDCVAPRLASLPGVDRDGDRWEFTGIDDSDADA